MFPLHFAAADKHILAALLVTIVVVVVVAASGDFCLFCINNNFNC